MLTVGVEEGGCRGESYEFSQLSVQLWVSDIVFIWEGGESRTSKRCWGEHENGRREWKGSMEPAGLNSTAEPLTPTIHQCRRVTRQGQGYATGGGMNGDSGW